MLSIHVDLAGSCHANITSDGSGRRRKGLESPWVILLVSNGFGLLAVPGGDRNLVYRFQSTAGMIYYRFVMIWLGLVTQISPQMGRKCGFDPLFPHCFLGIFLRFLRPLY